MSKYVKRSISSGDYGRGNYNQKNVFQNMKKNISQVQTFEEYAHATDQIADARAGHIISAKHARLLGLLLNSLELTE